MDTVFADMKKVLSGLDLLTKKIVKDGDIEDVKLLQERGVDMPAKSGLSFMSMMTTAFTTWRPYWTG